MITFSKLLCITSDNSALSHDEQVRLLIKYGAKFIQIRTKNLPQAQLEKQVSRALNYTKSKNVNLIVNDFVEVADKVNASGVHLGSFDESVLKAREKLGNQAIIGSTVHNFAEARRVKDLGLCDYVGLGPFRESLTKRNLTPFLSEMLIHEIVEFLSPLPVYLIGGLGLSDCKLISKYGLSGIAVCSSLSSRNDYGNNVGNFIKEIERVNHLVA